MPRGKSKNIAEPLYGVMLFIITGIMPLIVRAAVRPITPELFDLVGLTERADAFAYWKSWLLLVPAFIIFFHFISEWVTGGRKELRVMNILKNPPVSASLVYLLFVILSDLFTDYPYTAIHGTIDRFEGLFAQIAYIVIFISTLYYACDRAKLKFILAGLLFSSLVLGAVALSQTLGHDFFATPFGSILVTGQPGKATPKFDMAYGTLYNPNTLGLYASMLSPLLLLCGFTYDGKKWVNALLLLAGGLMLAAIAGSRSLGGALGMGAALVVLILTYFANRVVQKKLPPLPLCAAAAGLVVVVILSGMFVPPVNGYIKRQTAKLQLSLNEGGGGFSKLAYIFDNRAVTVLSEEQTLLFSLHAASDGWIVLRDPEGQIIPETQAEVPQGSEAATETQYVYAVPGYKNVKITRKVDHFIFDGFYLAVTDAGITAYRQSGLPIDMTKPIRTFGFQGRENWGTGRGYIWSRSLPLLLDHPILGSGSDSFINEFPQDDLAGKKQIYGNPYTVVDKAHNLYLQTGITTGGISMLALLFLLAYYMLTTFILLVKSKNESVFRFGLRLGILSAVAAFSVSSFATDSTIPTTGVFYVILGLGFALNTWPEADKNK